MAALAMIFSALGGLGLAWWTPNTAWLVVWMVIWSLGDHVIFAVEGPIGLKLARQGGEGRRLGHFGGFRNLGTIIGVGGIYLLAKLTGPRYDIFFTLMAACAIVAGMLFKTLRVGNSDVPSRRFVFRRRYGIFYAISALFGIRKQIFFAFGTWVLVDLYKVPVSTIALLYFIAALLGVVFRPLLGDVIDWLGERVVLAADEVLLIGICLAYAFASDLLAHDTALYVLYGAYILDHLLFALRIARTTYLKKIAEDPSHITPTISLGITIDHLVAMTLPVLSGYIWEAFGYRWVFILAGTIALVGFFVCLQIRTPEEDFSGALVPEGCSGKSGGMAATP
jgi:predicted MFS family arabinose efflux permease